MHTYPDDAGTTPAATHLDRLEEAMTWLDHIATQEDDLAKANKPAAERLHKRAAQIHNWAASVRWAIERERASKELNG